MSFDSSACAPPLELPAEGAPRQAPHLEPTVVLFLDHTAALSGGEIALMRLIEALDPHLVRPIVLLAATGPLLQRLAAAGIETHVIPLGENVRSVRKDTLGFRSAAQLGALFALLLYALRVACFARRCGARIIHTNSLKSDIYGGLAGWLARRPVVWHVRDHINASYLPPLAVALFRFLAGRMPSVVVTNSRSTLDELRLDGNRPAAVVPSGLGLRSSVVHDGLLAHQLEQDAAPAPSHPAEPPRGWGTPIRIGIVGRISRWKGQHIFLEAAARVLAAGHQARFLIVGAPLFGEEAYAQELRAQVSANGLAGHVEFLGFREDVQEILRSLDLMVHASIIPEPFGQVVIEAMAEGLPVIGSDGGGVREIIVHGENGLLVPMGDSTQLAEAIQRLLLDPRQARHLGQAAHQWVRAHFTAAQSARKIERVYHSLLSHGAN